MSEEDLFFIRIDDGMLSRGNAKCMYILKNKI